MAVTPRLSARIDRRLPMDVRTLCSTDDILQETFAEAAARYYSGDAKLKTEMPHLYDYFAANPFAKKDKGGHKAEHN